MIIERYRHPILFYTLSLIIPWVLWFIAAYVSHLEPSNNLKLIVSGLGIIGLISPVVIAFAFMVPDPLLRQDLVKKLFHFKGTKSIYIVLTCFLMLASILLAQAISLLFGYSASQFSFAKEFSFTGGVFSAGFLLVIAPILEELAWHLPLSFVKDYYQSHVVESGMIYSLNFIVSLIPFVINELAIFQNEPEYPRCHCVSFYCRIL